MGRLVAVTGATGHLGANLVRALVARGDRVRVLAFGDTKSIEGLELERVQGDLRDPDVLPRLFHDCELVFHLAARISITGDRDGSVHAINVVGVRRAAEAALLAGVRRFVHCSSVHAFDLRMSGLIDEGSPRAGPSHAAYDRSKAAGERELRAVIERGLDAVVVNPSGILGPIDHAPSRMGRVLLQLFRGSMPATVDGAFDWVDVRDVVKGLLSAADAGRVGEGYLLSGHHHTIRELTTMASAASGVRAPRFSTPLAIARLGAPFAEAISRVTGREPLFTDEALDVLAFPGKVSHAKATRELGHAPRPISESVRDAYRWFGESGAL